MEQLWPGIHHGWTGSSATEWQAWLFRLSNWRLLVEGGDTDFQAAPSIPVVSGVAPSLRVLTNFLTLCSDVPTSWNCYLLKLTQDVEDLHDLQPMKWKPCFHVCEETKWQSQLLALVLFLLWCQWPKFANEAKKTVHFSSFKHYKMSFFKVLGYKQLIYMNYIFPSALRNNIHLFFHTKLC